MLFLIFLGTSLNAQEDAMVKRSFLIIQSTKSYNAALRKAQLASNKLGLTLNLNGNYADKEEGLTNNEICDCGVKHGYIPRGRYDNGDYISIEYSSAFDSFTEGYYIVVVSSGNRENVEKSLPKTKEHYKDAYIKDSKVYVGCMH